MKNKTHVSRPFKLFLVLAVVAGGGLVLTDRYVTSMSDTPLGPTPISWGFKSNSVKVSTTFASGGQARETTPDGAPAVPEIDRAIPAETASALFALG